MMDFFMNMNKRGRTGLSHDATSPLNKTGLARLAAIVELTGLFFANRGEMKEMMARGLQWNNSSR